MCRVSGMRHNGIYEDPPQPPEISRQCRVYTRLITSSDRFGRLVRTSIDTGHFRRHDVEKLFGYGRTQKSRYVYTFRRLQAKSIRLVQVFYAPDFRKISDLSGGKSCITWCRIPRVREELAEGSGFYERERSLEMVLLVPRWPLQLETSSLFECLHTSVCSSSIYYNRLRGKAREVLSAEGIEDVSILCREDSYISR